MALTDAERQKMYRDKKKNCPILTEIKLCNLDIKWLQNRIKILEQLSKTNKPSAMQFADKLIKELE